MSHSYARGRKIYGFSAKNAVSLLWHLHKTKTNAYICWQIGCTRAATDIQRFSLWDRYRISKFPFITSSRAGNVCAIQCRRFTVFVRDRFWRTWYLRYGKRLHFLCPPLPSIPLWPGCAFTQRIQHPAPRGKPSPGLPFSPSLNAPDIQNNEINWEFVN